MLLILFTHIQPVIKVSCTVLEQLISKKLVKALLHFSSAVDIFCCLFYSFLLIMSASAPLLRSLSVTSHKKRCSSCPSLIVSSSYAQEELY